MALSRIARLRQSSVAAAAKAALVAVLLGGLAMPRLAAEDAPTKPLPPISAPTTLSPIAYTEAIPAKAPAPLAPVYTPPTDALHRIELSRGEHARIEYLAPLPLQVRYVNDGPTDLEVERPEASGSASRKWYRPLLDGQAQGYSFGARFFCNTTTMPDGSSVRTYTTPDKVMMTIPAGGRHVFNTSWQGEADGGWLADLTPGQYRLWIEDEGLATVSNQVTVDVVFTGLSLATCLQTVANAKEPDYKRKELSRWLEKLVPGLRFDWWGFSETDDAVKAAKEPAIQARLADCRAYIFDPANAADVDAAIAAINAEAFSIEINGRRVPIAPAKD